MICTHDVTHSQRSVPASSAPLPMASNTSKAIPDRSHPGMQMHFQIQSKQPQSCFLWLLPCQSSAWRCHTAAYTGSSIQQQTRTGLDLGTPLQACMTSKLSSAKPALHSRCHSSLGRLGECRAQILTTRRECLLNLYTLDKPG